VIYSYSTALVNQVYVGTLSVLSTATAGNCPAGRILHETGKKLFPGANNGVNDYMVSVYDPISMLTGFINPNQPFFSLMNTDRANFLLDGPNGAGTGLSASARANALYTRGDVLAGGRLDISGNSIIYGNELVKGSQSTLGGLDVGGSETINGSVTSLSTINAVSSIVSAQGQVRVNRVTSINPAANNTAIAIDPTLSQVFFITLANGGGTNAITSSKESEVTGGIIYIIVQNTSGSNQNIDFNANFRTENAGVYTINNATTSTFCFFCNGANFFQLGKAAQVISV